MPCQSEQIVESLEYQEEEGEHMDGRVPEPSEWADSVRAECSAHRDHQTYQDSRASESNGVACTRKDNGVDKQ